MLDSNIVIYLRDPLYSEKIVSMLSGKRLSTCNIIVAEVLGYGPLENIDSLYFSKLFSTMKNCQFDDVVTKKVIELRKTTNMQLPDAVIAATAVVNELVLWTHNTKDFKDVPGLQLFDPLAV